MRQGVTVLAMSLCGIAWGWCASARATQEQAIQTSQPRDPPPAPSRDQLLGRSRPPGSVARVFVEAEFRPQTPFVGQQAIYTVWLHTRHRVSQVRPVSLPQFSGSWVREIAAPSGGLRTLPVTLSGRRYWRAPVLRRAVFAFDTTDHRFAPIVLDLVVAVPERGLFGRLMERSRSLREASGAVRWRAKPLPPPPPDFSGAVGSLTLTHSLEPRRMQVGEAAVLTVTLRSTANLFSLPQPEIETPVAVDLYPPEDRISEEFHHGQLWTQRSWRFVLVARAPGSWLLPATELVYFDPLTGEYARATGEPLPFAAQKEAPALQVDPVDSPFPKDKPKDKPKGDFPDHRQLWFWTLLSALFLIGGLVIALRREVIWRRFRGWLRNGDSQLLTALDAVGRPSGSDRPDPLHGQAEAVEAAWADYLDRRWGIGIHPSASWRGELSRLGVDSNLIGRLEELADSLRLARAAPTLSDTSAVAEELLRHSFRLAERLGR